MSTDPRHSADVRRAAEWTVERLKRLGFQTTLHETSRHPVVYGELLRDPDLPTLLIYGHYDVQPPDPLDEWISPPFSPTVRDGFIYARGATDNKGQFFTYLKAVEALLLVEGRLPLNVKVLIEGEEESGGQTLLAEMLAYGVAGFHLDMVDQGFGPPHGCWCDTCRKLFEAEYRTGTLSSRLRRA